MIHRRMVILVLLTITSAVSLCFTYPAWAETPAGSNVDTRLNLALRVPQAELQGWLPAPWQVNPIGAGPSKEANLILVFFDQLLNLDAEGKPVAGGTNRGVALVVPAKHPQTGESTLFVIRGFVANPSGIPGPYKNYVQASIRREQTLKGDNLEPGVGGESWELRDTAGGMLELRIQYRRALPARAKGETKVRSAVEPTFFRIYRTDQGADTVKSVPAGIDRVQSYQLRVTVSELRKLFDGTEQLVSAAVLPWYVRQIFLP